MIPDIVALLCRYGFMPHRVAFWIYWQALHLLWLGVPFYSYPATQIQEGAEHMASNPKDSAGRHFWWQSPRKFPWERLMTTNSKFFAHVVL